MPAVTITIRSNQGVITMPATAADVIKAILAGNDILFNGQLATINNIGGPNGTWLIQGQPVATWFQPPATGPNVHPPVHFTPAPNGVTSYWDANGHYMVWNPYSAQYIDQGGSDTASWSYLALGALLIYFLFFRKN